MRLAARLLLLALAGWWSWGWGSQSDSATGSGSLDETCDGALHTCRVTMEPMPKLGSCGVDIVDSFTSDAFRTQIRGRKPAVIRGVGRSLSELWTPAYLREKAGGSFVQTGRQKGIAKEAGVAPTNTTLGDFFDVMQAEEEPVCAPSDERIMVFDNGDFLEASKLDGDLSAHLDQARDYLDVFGKAEETSKYFSLGGCCSGLAFHVHSEVFNIQLFGKKHWMLYPRGKKPPGGNSMRWLTGGGYEMLDSGAKPKECTLGPQRDEQALGPQ